MKGKRSVVIYLCYQTDSGVTNPSIHSAVFLASPYYNYVSSTACTTMLCWRCHRNSVYTGSQYTKKTEHSRNWHNSKQAYSLHILRHIRFVRCPTLYRTFTFL